MPLVNLKFRNHDYHQKQPYLCQIHETSKRKANSTHCLPSTHIRVSFPCLPTTCRVLARIMPLVNLNFETTTTTKNNVVAPTGPLTVTFVHEGDARSSITATHLGCCRRWCGGGVCHERPASGGQRVTVHLLHDLKNDEYVC